MNEPNIQVTPADLFAMIGEQAVELRLLRSQIAVKDAKIAELTPKEPPPAE